MIAGFAVGVGTSWSGVGVVGGGFMIANGGAAIWSGISQIVNDVSGSNYHEENYIRTGARAVGNAIAGTQGEKVGATIYDAANFASTAYSIIGGGATGLSQTVKSIGKTTAITKQTFSMLPRNPFMDKYAVDIGMATTKYISLPKPWFRAVNGVGAIIDATTTGKNICEGLINIFGEEEE